MFTLKLIRDDIVTLWETKHATVVYKCSASIAEALFGDKTMTVPDDLHAVVTIDECTVPIYVNDRAYLVNAEGKTVEHVA